MRRGGSQRWETRTRGGRAFTLVELMLVMALLITLVALIAPSLSRTMRQRNLEEQATRLLALTEFSRDEAASAGVPVVVWVNPETRRYGADVKSGYAAGAIRAKEYTLPGDLSFEPVDDAQAPRTSGHGYDVAEFLPDGTLDTASLPALRITDRAKSETVSVTQTADGYGYEIVKPEGSRR